jgi:hypothetical protein
LEFEDDDGTGESAITSRTGIAFGARSVTRTETLSFELGSQIVGEFGGDSDDKFELENTNASLAYRRQGASSELRFSSSYREYDLEDETIVSGPVFGIGTGTIIISDGTAAVTRLDAALETGIDQPVGFEFAIGYYEEDFSGTDDEDLVDNETYYTTAIGLFRIDPSRTIRVLAGVTRDSEESTDTDNYYVGVGLSAQTAGGLAYTGDLLFDQTETGLVSDEGLGVELSVIQQRPAGSYGFELSSRIDEDGRRTEATLSRDFELQSGTLEFAFGVVDQEGDTSLRPKASVEYERDTRSGALTASLTQSPSVDDAAYYSNTDLSVGYRDQINELSGWSAELTYTAVNQLGGSDDDDRTRARITYTRKLTEDWEMNTGLQHTSESSGGGSTDTSNMVFFNIQRDITFGF